MDQDYDKKVADLKNKIKSFPDFPKKGILFWDIFSAISDGPTCKLLQGLLIHTIRTKFPDVEAVVGLEARGFLFCFSLAQELGIGCLPIRKKGKLPGDVVSYKYDLEYGSDILEIQKASIRPGLKCVLLDDLLATGGTITAATKLLSNCGAKLLGGIVVMELISLEGRKNIPEGIPIHSLGDFKLVNDRKGYAFTRDNKQLLLWDQVQNQSKNFELLIQNASADGGGTIIFYDFELGPIVKDDC